MGAVFKKYQINKNGLSKWIAGMGKFFLTGAFFLLFSSVGLAVPPVPLPPHPPLPPGPPPPHLVLPPPPILVPPLPPAPPGVIHYRPGHPPYPGWVWVPGYYRGHQWVPGHWSKPKKYRPGYDHGPRYAPGPPPPPGPRYHPGPPPPPGPHPPYGR
jgi:hypothetical protein